MEDYLLQPVQRVFRYPLLLEAQQKACGEGLVGQTDLAAAVEMMREVSHTINTAKRESELQSIVNGTVAITRSKPLQDRLQVSRPAVLRHPWTPLRFPRGQAVLAQPFRRCCCSVCRVSLGICQATVTL